MKTKCEGCSGPAGGGQRYCYGCLAVILGNRDHALVRVPLRPKPRRKEKH